MPSKRPRTTTPVKDIHCYAVAASEYDQPYLIYSTCSLDTKLSCKRLKLVDQPHSPLLSYAYKAETEDCCGGFGWTEQLVAHPAHGNYNLLQHLQEYKIHTPNKQQKQDDQNPTQDNIMVQMANNIAFNTSSNNIYHAISLATKKWVKLRITRQRTTQTQPNINDLQSTIASLKRALLTGSVLPICCQDCKRTITNVDDFIFTPSGDTYCSSCY
jgi:hypothetical protein